MKLIVDLGNTTSKFFFFAEKDLKGDVFVDGLASKAMIQKIITDHGPFTAAILSSVVNTPLFITGMIGKHCPLMVFNVNTPVPLLNLYQTPETLGTDRLAAAVGAYALFPENPVLVVDAGTCIKFDLVVDHAYRGGMIAPGLAMQASALNTFTTKLPLVTLECGADIPLTGTDTLGALRSGIFNTTLASISGIIERYITDYADLRIILSGGDMNYFVKWLKYSIFALPNVVAAGLNEILDFNEKKLS